MQEHFRAFRVEERTDGSDDRPTYKTALVKRSTDDLPDGDVLIRVRYSSLNYKDALSAQGNKGVTRHYPHTPGIDAAGEVVMDGGGFRAGDEVVVIGYDLGMDTDGGFGQYIRVPADWVSRLPEGLSQRESMIIGTAGFTAALCVEKLLQNGLEPGQGPVLVSGATGGVGSYAVALLARLGFPVTALTGKAEAETFLKSLGANDVMDRAGMSEENSRPMLKEQWAGAVDTVGGEILGNTLKSLRYGGSVACCGLVASPAFKTTVLPFILRGINLLGVDSVNLPLRKKQQVWQQLGQDWKIDTLESLATEIGMGELDEALRTVLAGGARGRYLLNLDRD
ncbi:MAG: YhdH/YhfP family quinone oxidoreductase [Pseudomonadota bacterium]